MRGYLTFLLVLVSVIFILIIIQASQLPYQVSFSKAIAAERTYQVQMNSKEVILETIRLGAWDGYYAYTLFHHESVCETEGPEHPNCFRIPEARLWTQLGIYARLATLDTSMFDEEIEIEVFCRRSITDEQARDIAKSKRKGATNSLGNYIDYGLNLSELVFKELGEYDPGNPPDFESIKLPGCMASVYTDISPLENTDIENSMPNKDPELKSIRLTDTIVVSAYYKTFDVASVSHIPAGWEVEP